MLAVVTVYGGRLVSYSISQHTADQRWKSKYYHEKQRTPLLESQLAAARSHSLARVIPTPTHLQMRGGYNVIIIAY